MLRVQWPLRHGRPCVEIALTLAVGGQPLPRVLLADTGAGAIGSGFELVLHEDDCILADGLLLLQVTLGGAYTGEFPLYLLPVRVAALGFDQPVRAVSVPSVPVGFDGIACFSFLNMLTYGNFGDPSQFGLEN